MVSECVGVGGQRGAGHRLVRTLKWKYVLTGTNDEALFDEEEDPYELSNGADLAENRRVLRKMRSCLRQWMARVGDTHERPPLLQ